MLLYYLLKVFTFTIKSGKVYRVQMNVLTQTAMYRRYRWQHDQVTLFIFYPFVNLTSRSVTVSANVLFTAL